MGKKITPEEYDIKLDHISGGNIVRKGLLTSMNDKVHHKCIVCKHNWYPRPSELTRTSGKNKGCPVCAKVIGATKRKKYYKEEILTQLKNILKQNPNLTITEIRQTDLNFYYACITLFRTMEEAFKAAGYDSKKNLLNKRINAWVEKCKNIYGDFFDYSLAVGDYEVINSIVRIICPEHGVFEQYARAHSKGFIGCEQCMYNCWDEVKVVKELKRLYKKGIDLSPISISEDEEYKSLYNWTRQNGGYGDFLEKSGIPTEEIFDRFYWSDYEVINYIKEVFKKYKTLTRVILFNKDDKKLKSLLYHCDSSGGWYSWIKKAGFQEKSFKKPGPCRAWCKGLDGEIYESFLEKAVGDFLFINKITYETKVLIDPDNKRRNCDFVIWMKNGQEKWIEVDGMGKKRRGGSYCSGSNAKINYYMEEGFNFDIIKNEGDIQRVLGRWAANF